MRLGPGSIIALGLIAGIGTAATSSAWAAQPAGSTSSNRYIMTPTDGGFVRMDTQTGALSYCSTQNGTLRCKLSTEDQLALSRQVEKLAKDNQELKEENRRLEDMLLGDDKDKSPGSRSRAFKLPSEKEVDQALSYIERMYKKFRDKFKELENRKKHGSPTPNEPGATTPL